MKVVQKEEVYSSNVECFWSRFSSMVERESVLTNTRRYVVFLPNHEMKEKMKIQMVFVLVMKRRTERQRAETKKSDNRRDRLLFTFLRPPCVPNPNSSEDLVEMDMDWINIPSCSRMVYVYDVHVFDFKFLLLTSHIGPTFTVIGGCAPGECVCEILLSESRIDSFLKGNGDLLWFCRPWKLIGFFIEVGTVELLQDTQRETWQPNDIQRNEGNRVMDFSIVSESSIFKHSLRYYLWNLDYFMTLRFCHSEGKMTRVQSGTSCPEP